MIISKKLIELDNGLLMEVEIGIGFSAEGNIFVAKGKANANLKVKLVLSPKG
jgi:hypothetical protein